MRIARIACGSHTEGFPKSGHIYTFTQDEVLSYGVDWNGHLLCTHEDNHVESS